MEKICPICCARNEDETSCIMCGTPLEVSAPKKASELQNSFDYLDTKNNVSNHKQKLIIPIICILVFSIVIILLGIIVIGKSISSKDKSNGKSHESSQISEVSDTTDETSAETTTDSTTTTSENSDETDTENKPDTTEATLKPIDDNESAKVSGAGVIADGTSQINSDNTQN